jgi:hypothetical protein
MTKLVAAFRNFANAPKNLAFFRTASGFVFHVIIRIKTSYFRDIFKCFVFVVETQCVS